MICNLVTKICSHDQIMKNEMGAAWSTNATDERQIQEVGGET
jgi:hypothetical protein